jgi:predicted ATPase
MKPNDRPELLRIRLRNLLSFGPHSPDFELTNLNVLIGPNGSGKSNLIDAISLLRATPMSPVSSLDVRAIVRRGGGVDEWIRKGGTEKVASIYGVVKYLDGDEPLTHFLSFSSHRQGFHREEEKIGPDLVSPHWSIDSSENGGLSVLAVIRDPERYPEFSYLTDFYEKIRIYREWTFGRKTIFREPQQADMRDDRLEEDFSNLGLFLIRLCKSPTSRNTILEKLKDLFDGVTDFDSRVDPDSGTVQLFLKERGIKVSARRLSDGTLHYLCLLAILCDPSPPPLICIEEPELGLHPDILPKIADLLLEASERTQLIVTTHSDVLIDAMTEHPEAVVVCEKRDGQTQMRRLTKDELTPWLGRYRLGQLWSKGQIGGNRW